MRSPARWFALAAWLCATAAQAQTTDPYLRVDGGPWRPELAVDPNALPYVEGTLVPGAGNWNLQSVVEYVNRPLVVIDGTNRLPLIEHQLWGTLGLQVGIGSRMAAALQVPLLLHQEGDAGSTGATAPASSAIGDLRALLRWSTRAERTESPSGQNTSARIGQSQRERREGFGLGINLAVTIPVADARSYASAGAPTAHLFAVTDFRLARLMGAVSLGYRARFDGTWPAQSGQCFDPTSPSCLFDVPLRDQITWGVAVRQPLEGLIAGLLLLVKPEWASAAVLSGYYAATYLTLQGAIDARAPFASSASTPMELGTGLQGIFGEFTVSLGASFGLTNAPGSANVRGIAMLQWSPRFIDEDHDGLRDDPSIDHCIGLAEDFDGYQDNDGCPEDNDTDAIPDEEDRCPTVNEDEDGFEDEDGCPDPDNDRDGVLDTDDACPDQAQGEHPDPARRGCPESDGDHDGVSGSDDACPDVPQGDHPDPARAGCPAPSAATAPVAPEATNDRDHDGVLDADDLCPADAAGANAVPAQRGCPDADRDHDGVPDATDRCAGPLETINGVQDDDGCPERVTPPARRIEGATVRVRVLRAGPTAPATVQLVQPVAFDDHDQVTAESGPVLDQLAVAIRAATRPGLRVMLLSSPHTPPTVRGPAAVTAERADRRRDAVIAALRTRGVGELVLQPAPSTLAPPLVRRLGVVLRVRVTPGAAPPVRGRRVLGPIPSGR